MQVEAQWAQQPGEGWAEPVQGLPHGEDAGDREGEGAATQQEAHADRLQDGGSSRRHDASEL
jgi:hypothetical protein